MAMAEVDENELLQLKGLAGVMHKLVSNPKTRAELQRLRKEVEPNLVIPELEVRNEVNSEIKTLNEKLSALEKKQEEEKSASEQEKKMAAINAKWEKTRSAVRRAGVTEEGLSGLEKFMEDNGILDHEIALPAYERMHPKDAPIASTGNRFDFFKATTAKDDDMKLLFEGNDRQFLNNRIAQTLAEVRSGNR